MMKKETAESPKSLSSRRRTRALARRLASLRARRDIRAVARLARAGGFRAWIVGGAVRDALLSRPVFDVDLAISGDAERLAKALEREGLGRPVALSPAAPRVFRLAGRRELDIAELEGGSIERDLARRDFTVNAMAADLLSGEFLDPHGGLSDLLRGDLRLVSEANLAEDPLRTFRAARFLATHGLLPVRGTLAACRRHAAALSSVAAERIRVELIRILEAPRASPALSWAASAGLLSPALRAPAFARGGKAVARGLDILDSPAVRRGRPEKRKVLRLTLLAARLGGDRSEDVRSWLRRGRWPRDLAGEVDWLLRLAESARISSGETEEWRWVRDAGRRWRDALTILLALAPAERPRARRLARRAASARRGPRVGGADVLAWTGLSPGPAVGKLLEEVEVAILRGHVRSRREARDWLTNRRTSDFSEPGRGRRGL